MLDIRISIGSYLLFMQDKLLTELAEDQDVVEGRTTRYPIMILTIMPCIEVDNVDLSQEKEVVDVQ